MGPPRVEKGENGSMYQKQYKNQLFLPLEALLGVLWGSSGAVLGASWAFLKPSLAVFGPF